MHTAVILSTCIIDRMVMRAVIIPGQHVVMHRKCPRERAQGRMYVPAGKHGGLEAARPAHPTAQRPRMVYPKGGGGLFYPAHAHINSDMDRGHGDSCSCAPAVSKGATQIPPRPIAAGAFHLGAASRTCM